ncbi:MAG: peptide-methionine (R)-S-oxide reductase MsrB [Pseudomonadota bacterium]|nr:peptide-methionine (R)-S-oxide reductase MsrB [Pseudomonadota bacterium]
MKKDRKSKIEKTDHEWRSQLTPAQYMVTRAHGTEPAFSHPSHNDKTEGTYNCVCCEAPLFSSSEKFNSGTGWPSFWEPVSKSAIDEHEDSSFFMRRTEVRCSACDAHLGHVFPDGPKPTGLRYCINGVAMKFDEAATKKKKA